MAGYFGWGAQNVVKQDSGLLLKEQAFELCAVPTSWLYMLRRFIYLLKRLSCNELLIHSLVWGGNLYIESNRRKKRSNSRVPK